MSSLRSIRLVAVAAVVLLLAGCAGLPTSGPPNPGLAVGEDGEAPVFTPIAPGPAPGAGPQDIVDGFLEASMTPAGNWEIAQEFLTEDFKRIWKPDATVTIDSSVVTRRFTPSVDADDDSATGAEVKVQFDQVASVDADGAYSAAEAPGKATYQLTRSEGGEWRIAKANDGIVLDAETFQQVYQRHSLKYFDPGWTHLVPDVRWFPRRPAMATTIARTVISGKPSEWLAPAVRTAFTEELSLAGDAVTVNSAQVASVALSRTALSATPTELSRMRTQLEASLAGAGVSEVRFTVDGTPLDAGTAVVDDVIVDPGVLVLNEETFGRAVSGTALEPVGELTAQLAKSVDPIRALDVSLGASLAAMQLRDGSIWTVSAGASDELDERAGLIEPSLDPFGFIWAVPRGDPTAALAWTTGVEAHPIDKAWPSAESISHLRVSADGARAAAVITSAGEHRLVVTSVLRGEDFEPVELGDIHEIGTLPGAASGLAWVGPDTLAVLTSNPDPALVSYSVGGPSSSTPAPDGATALAGAKTPTGLRVLSSDGTVYAQRGSSWQIAVQNVLVLGTRAGY